MLLYPIQRIHGEREIDPLLKSYLIKSVAKRLNRRPERREINGNSLIYENAKIFPLHLYKQRASYVFMRLSNCIRCVGSPDLVACIRGPVEMAD
jgi:hypothetical protein